MKLSDPGEFEALFRAHYADLVRYVIRMTQDQALAEDIVQQVFSTLWEKRSELSIEGSAKSYLLRATHNHTLNHFNHLKVRSAYQTHQKHTEEASLEGSPERAVEAEEFRIKVREAVQTLPKECRRIFLMSRSQGLKYQQIADELGISIKTVENQMGKALKLLRTELEEEVRATLRVLSIIFWMLIGVKHVSLVIR